MAQDRVTDEEFRAFVEEIIHGKSITKTDWVWLMAEIPLQQLADDPDAPIAAMYRNRLTYAIDKFRQAGVDMTKIDASLAKLRAQGRWTLPDELSRRSLFGVLDLRELPEPQENRLGIGGIDLHQNHTSKLRIGIPLERLDHLLYSGEPPEYPQRRLQPF